MKEFFAVFNSIVKQAFAAQSFVLHPVGSYVIGCMVSYNITIDCYIKFDARAEDLLSEKLSIKSIKERIDEVLKQKNRVMRCNYFTELSSDNQEFLLVRDSMSKSSIRLIHYDSHEAENGPKVSRCSAGIQHSKWLIQNYNQSNVGWKAIKLFRLVRIWR